MPKHPLQSALENNDCNVREYSGRGMYGKYCLGVTVDDGMTLGELICIIMEEYGNAREIEHERQATDIIRAMKNLRSDSMGRGTIYYWPNVPFSSDDD